jgi:hypothetical protein
VVKKVTFDGKPVQGDPIAIIIMAEEIVLNDQNVPRPPLQDELSRLYCQGSLTDITLTTEDGKNFEAHKIILAAR